MNYINLSITGLLVTTILGIVVACGKMEDSVSYQNSEVVWECYHTQADESFSFKEEDILNRVGDGCYLVKDSEGYKRPFCVTSENQSWVCKGQTRDTEPY